MKEIEISASELEALKKKRRETREGGEANELRDFISVMYNIIMILLWYAFACCYLAELYKFGPYLTTEQPLYYLQGSIGLLKIVQFG
jgi:hypothetical protein